ncbi:MAG TPA: hypothetical protein VKB31_03935 [Trueperaceae bacterium]|nr:hypothetical protein [Trueperaceae bacterium]
MASGARIRRFGAAHGLGLALLLTVLASPLAHAQLLADVTLSAAIATEFDPSLHLPSGSLRAVGSGTEALIARVSDKERWSGWEVYAARGLAAGLQNDYVHQVATAFALDGYFESGSRTTTVGPETRTRIVFQGADGGERLLYVIRTSQEVVWLTAHSN